MSPAMTNCRHSAPLSLAMLRRRIVQQLDGQQCDIRLLLDRKARLERDQRRKGGHGGMEQWRR